MRHNYTDHSGKQRTSEVRKVLIITLALNLLASGAKILYGYYIGSVAVTSDGYHSLFDGVSNIVGLIGIYHASHPPDEEHPYGHRKYETVFTIFIAALMFLACIGIFKGVYEAFSAGTRPEVSFHSFFIMAATLLVNLFVTFYEKKKGKELASEYLLADVEHTKSDIYASLGVIGGLALAWYGVPNADAFIGAFVGVLVAKAGIDILREATDILVDRTQADPRAIIDAATSVPGVTECHEIRTRGTRGHIFIDLHILVDPAMTVGKAHAIADSVEEAIKKNIPGVVDVMVHVEPMQ